ncbi:amidase [Neisseriaceae bacterium TC5R-5]|nr:amidase [Neisseriaceae bacterium TC5R-5]
MLSAASSKQIVGLGALELSAAIHARHWSCVEVMQAYLAQIERCNPQVNALVSLQPVELLLQQAQQCDQQLARGEDGGWMHGFPQAVKDLAATAGIITSMGSPLFADYRPAHDALAVARLKKAGAIIIGKSNTPEFGAGSQTYNPVFGATANAYVPTLCAGGSSGGAAVALALHMQPVADGSDMMGSLRNPAAFNNVFGFRPSTGAVALGPLPELYCQQLATEGPMGRSVPDILALLRTQAGYDARAPLSFDLPDLQQPLQRELRGVRLGWLGDYAGYLPTEAGVLTLCEQALSTFSELGAVVEAAQPDFEMARLWSSWQTLRQWLLAGQLHAAYRQPAQRSLLKPEIQWEIEGGLALSALDIYQASQTRSDWYREMLRLFARYDYLLLPSAQVFPFALEQHWPQQIAGKTMSSYHRWMEVVLAATMAGLPVISVPVGFNAAGLPMGMQIIGKPRGDMAVLQLAHAYDLLTRWVVRRPPDLALAG